MSKRSSPNYKHFIEGYITETRRIPVAGWFRDAVREGIEKPDEVLDAVLVRAIQNARAPEANSLDEKLVRSLVKLFQDERTRDLAREYVGLVKEWESLSAEDRARHIKMAIGRLRSSREKAVAVQQLALR